MSVGGGEDDLVRQHAGGRSNPLLGLGCKGEIESQQVGWKEDDFVGATEIDGAGTQRLVDALGALVAVAVSREPDGMFRGDIYLRDADSEWHVLLREKVCGVV